MGIRLKIKRICTFFQLIILLLVTAGCSQNSVFYSEDYKIGIIETTGQKNDSVITYYDEMLNKVNSRSLPYGTMGNIFYNPVIYLGKLYVIPQGPADTKDLKMVLEMDLDTGNTKEYHINQLAMNSLAVNEKYIITCNTYNGTSYINRCEKENGKVISIRFPDIYISKLVFMDTLLYAFGTKKEADSLVSFLYQLDTDLKVLKTVDITAGGSSQYKTAVEDGVLYFSNSMDRYDRPNSYISRVSAGDSDSLKTACLKVDNLKLDNAYPSDILTYGDYLIIAHCNLVLNEGHLLTFYNRENNKKTTITLKHTILQMNRDGDYLYIIDRTNLYQYKIKKATVELVKRITINTMEEKGIYYYVSGFFLK